MPRFRGRALAAMLFAAATLAAAPAHADEAEDLIARGIELRTMGKDEEALGNFRRAQELAPSARARAQVALAEQALGLWASAERDLVAALAVEDPWITKNRGALEGALAVVRRHLGSLEVRGPAGASVSLDGVTLGVLPASVPFRVETGSHRMTVTADRHHPVARVVEIPPGGVVRETVTLVPMPEPGEPGEAAPGRASVGASDGRTQRLVGWVLAGTGGGLLLAGGAAAWLKEKNAVEYNDAVDDEGKARCALKGQPDSAYCAGLADDKRTWQTVSISAFVGGGVLALGGLVLVLTTPKSPSSSRAAAIVGCSPGASPDALAFGCVGRF